MRREEKGGRNRTRGLAWASILVPLGLGFVLSLLLAQQALDAGNRHQAAARGVARDQAQFAAYLLASSVDRQLQQALLFAFYPIDLALGRSPGPPPHPDVLVAEPEVSRCGPELPGDRRHFFRYLPASGETTVVGPDAEASAGWIGDAMMDETWDREGFRHALVELAEGPRLLVFRPYDEGGVVYGFESCWQVAGRNVFEEVMGETQAFSPNQVGDTPNDSLFSLAARYENERLAFGDSWTRPERGLYGGGDFYGTVDLLPRESYAGVQLRVTLLPRVAERLVRGGLPPSRLPLAIGLLTLNAVLMWVAVRQLRRGHELVSLRASFVRNVSHELRTPLQQILLFTELLRSERIGEGDERRRALDIMHGEIQRLIELVRNLLRFSESPEESLRLTAVDLEPLVGETVEGFRPLAQSRKDRLEVTVDEGPRVVADEDTVKRVLINLLDNAVKYGPEGQRVGVEVGVAGEWGFIAVSDQGPGIPPEDRERIWEAFRRLDRDEEGASAGSGIGLAIVARLVQAMRGRVSVEDGPEGGARFVVRLPLAQEGGPPT